MLDICHQLFQDELTPERSQVILKEVFQKINDKFKSKEEAIERLVTDIKKFKVALPDHFTSKQLYEVLIISLRMFRDMEKRPAI